MSSMNFTDPAILAAALKEITFLHPLKGELSFESLFRAHGGFVCFLPEYDEKIRTTLMEQKKELDPLGLQLIVFSGTPGDDREILVIERPSLVEEPGSARFLFIEEGWKKALFVDAVGDFLKIAADHIELDSQSVRHLSLKMKTILAEKEIPLPPEPGGCSCCKKCH